MSSSKKKCIVTIYFKSTVVAFSVDDKRYPDRAIPFRDCYNKPENCSDFLKELSARIPINEIEAIVFLTDRFPAIPLKKLQLFHEQLRNFCKNREIFCHFPNQETAFVNGLIMNAKPNVEEYGCVAIMLAAPGIIVCHILIRVGKYFKLIEVDRFEVRDLVKNKRDLMERFDVEFVITCNMATHSDPRIFGGQIDFSDLIKKFILM
uniref:Uncharacterized protein n=1 Tax=Panagrolaimus superbus TaxID=310955 RepID=A0A914YIT3_9BILA